MNNVQAILILSILIMSFLSTGIWTTSPALAQDAELQTSYSLDAPDVTKPMTMKVDQHVYQPGEQVVVEGSVWSEIIDNVDALGVVKMELKNEEGDVVERKDASVESNGNFETTMQLLESASEEVYTLEAGLELEADALGIIETITSAALRSSVQFAVSELVDYPVNAEDQDFTVDIATNSEVDNFEFNQQEKKIAFVVDGEDGSAGFTEVTIPKRLLSGEMTVFVDENVVTTNDVIVKSNTETEMTLEINYHHSIHQIEIVGTNVVPEFPFVAIVIAVTMAMAAGISLMARKGSIFG